MGRREQFTVGELTLTGNTMLVGAETISILQKDASGMILMATGTTVPTDATAGYAKGCLFIDTNVVTGSTGLYENVGTTTSCNFDALGVPTVGELSLAVGSMLVGAGTGVATAIDAKTDTAILIGNGTTVTAQTLDTDVTMTNTGAVTIANDAVTYAKMQDVSATDRLLGRDTAGAGNVEELTVGGGLEFSGAGGIRIADEGVTYAKMQHVSATDRLLGRDTAAAGDVEELTLSGGLEFSGAGSVRIADAGVTTAKIADANVTAAKWDAGAGVAAVLSAGLGGSDAIIKTDTDTHTLVAAHGTKDRACLVVATVTEAFATGDTSRTMIQVGEDDTVAKLWDVTSFPNAMALGTVLVGAFTNLATKKIIATSVAAAGTGTGGVAITVIAIPTT